MQRLEVVGHEGEDTFEEQSGRPSWNLAQRMQRSQALSDFLLSQSAERLGHGGG